MPDNVLISRQDLKDLIEIANEYEKVVIQFQWSDGITPDELTPQQRMVIARAMVAADQPKEYRGPG